MAGIALRGRPDVNLGRHRGLTGDISGDGHVNVADLLILAGSWAKNTGQPDLSPACDLNSAFTSSQSH
jgi:hypothetical protein